MNKRGRKPSKKTQLELEGKEAEVALKKAEAEEKKVQLTLEDRRTALDEQRVVIEGMFTLGVLLTMNFYNEQKGDDLKSIPAFDDAEAKVIKQKIFELMKKL